MSVFLPAPSRIDERMKQHLEILQLQDLLAETRLKLGHAEEAKAAAEYELAEFKKLFQFDPDGDSYATVVLRSWSNCLDNVLVPKHHWIDALAITTRRMVEENKRLKKLCESAPKI